MIALVITARRTQHYGSLALTISNRSQRLCLSCRKSSLQSGPTGKCSGVHLNLTDICLDIHQEENVRQALQRRVNDQDEAPVNATGLPVTLPAS